MEDLTFQKMKEEFSDAIRKCARAASIEPIQLKFSTFGAIDSEKRHVMDHAFREKVPSILANPNNTNISIFENLVKLSIAVCRKEMCNNILPVVLLSDIFESLTLENSEKLFNFVEESVHIWKEESFFSSGKNHILRMCNDLLRRLSRSQNTVFCGRILLFLAKFFPFSERSGLNIVSEFNLENVTEYSTVASDEVAKGNKEDADSKTKFDYNLYCKFWALQDFFRNPNQCYCKPQWKTFTSHANDVLNAFSSYKLEEGGSGELKKGSVIANQQYFAKYLTSQKLLELQLSDTNFRRYVLLQFLILFQYLTSTVKFRSDSDELRPEQLELVKETTETIYKLMAETPPHGAEFAKGVKHILQRESHWNTWKNEGCHEFKKPLTSDTPQSEIKPKRKPAKRLGDQIREATENKRFLMGNPELTKLWNQASNNLEACRSKERDFHPSLETYFEEAIAQANPNNMIEDKYKKVHDGSFGWRALRLMARRSPHFFTHSNSQISKLPAYLEMMVKKIAKDLPSGSAFDDKSEDTDLAANTQEAEDDELLEEPKDTFKEAKDEPEDVKDEQMDDENSDETPTIILTQELLDSVAKVVATEWERVAGKLGYKEDEIEYLKGEHDNDIDRCIHLLKIWKQDDDDASAGGLAYTLSGLGLADAAALLQ